MAENNKPFVSIIVPCYNTEKYIKKSFDSMMGQSYKDFEIIFIDDGSTDSTAQIVDGYREKYPDIIRVIHKENEGQSIARNMAIDIAYGKYCIFWDSDDYADVDYLERLVGAAKDGDRDVVISGSHYVDENGVILENLNYPVDRYPGYALRRLSPHGKMYKIEFLNKHNIRFAPKKIYEDNPFNFQAMFLTKNQTVLPYCGHYQVVHMKSSTTSSMTSDKVPYEALTNALCYVDEHKDELVDWNLYEFVVLSYFTFLIFVGNREHMNTATGGKGYKIDKPLVKELCDFTQKELPKHFPHMNKNSHVGIFKERDQLDFRHRAGVWLFTKLIKTHTLKPFALLFYMIIR